MNIVKIRTFLTTAMLAFFAGIVVSGFDTMAAEFPAHYTKVYDGLLNIDADILVSEELNGREIHQASAEIIKPDVELILQETERYTGKTFTKMQELEQEDYQGIMVYSLSYTSPDQGGLSINYSQNQNSILHYPVGTDKVFSAFRLADDPGYNAQLYRTEEEFSFASSQQAFLEVCNYLNAVGIAPGKNYTCYRLDYQMLQAEEVVYDDPNPTEPKVWSEADNAYYFAMNQEISGLPVYIPLYGLYADDIDYNAPIQVMYKAGGIDFIQTGTMYNLQEMETLAEPLDIEAIFENIYEKYNMLITDDVINITKAKLCWIPKEKQKELVLCWSIRGNTSSGESVQLFFNAETGKEMIGITL